MNMMLKGVCVLLGALVIAGAQSVHAEETVHVPRQPYELCFADSMNEVHAPNGIESGWEIDNRAGRPRTELDSSGVLSSSAISTSCPRAALICSFRSTMYTISTAMC